MKKLRKFALAFVLVLIMGVSVLTGCSISLQGMPDLNDAVTSNGGLAVQKGNYLYFVNGYVDATASNNEYGKADQGAIYRAKLTNNKITYDESGNPENVELVVPKVAGYKKTGLYIFGDYLYYSTPNTEPDRSTGNVDTKLLDFYKVKLNGTDNTFLFKTATSSDNTQFAFYSIENVVYLVSYDSKNLVIVNCDTKASTQVASDVSSVVMPQVEGYNRLNNTISQIESNIYYTRSAIDGEVNSGNVLAYVDIKTQKESVVKGLDLEATYTVKELSYAPSVSSVENNSYLLFTSNESGLELYYTASFNNNELNFNENKPEVMTAKAQENVVYLYTNRTSTNVKEGLITTNSKKYLTVIDMENEYKENATVYNELGEITILKVIGSTVFYYDSNNMLYTYDLISNTKLQLTTEGESYNFANEVKIDVCGSYVYIFKDYTGEAPEGEDGEKGSYLIRIEYLGNQDYEDELVGKLLDIHTPKVEEESEEK